MKNGDIKIANFGSSDYRDESFLSRYDHDELPFIDVQKLIESDYTLDKRSNIYSLGIVLWEISSCYPPFSRIKFYSYYRDYIHRGLKEKPVKGTPIEFLEIYTDCWKLNPDSRPSIDQIFSRMQSMLFEQHDS